MEKVYEVVNIYRFFLPTQAFCFVLYSDKFEQCRVADEMTEKVARGIVFIGDFITKVVKTPDGITFEACDTSMPVTPHAEPKSLIYTRMTDLDPSFPR